MNTNKLLNIIILVILSLLPGCEANELFNSDNFEVTSYSPKLHETGITEDAVIEITFNNEADTDLVEQYFTLTGPSGKEEGQFTWLSQHTFQFRPRYGLKLTKRYTIEIPREVRNRKGKKLKSIFLSDFYAGDPSAEFLITSTSPEHIPGGNIYNPDLPPLGNGPLNQILINFNSPINRIKTEAAFSISPNIPGRFDNTSGPNELIYIFTNEPEYGKQYKVTVASTAEDLNSNILGTDHKIIFIYGDDTEPPTVEIGADPNDLWPIPNTVTEVKHTIEYIYIVFKDNSNAMDRSSCQLAFSIDPPVDGHLTWYNEMTMRYKLEENLKQEQLYTITIDTGAKDSHGLKLKNPYHVLIKTTLPESKHITIGKVLGSGDNVFDEATELLFNGEEGDPHAKVWPHTPTFQSYIIGSDTIVKCYIKIQFLQNSSPVSMNETSIYGNYFVEPVSVGLNPSVTRIDWLSSSEAVIEISDLQIKTAPEEQNLYRFTLYGNESGITDINGNTMNGNLVFEFKHKE